MADPARRAARTRAVGAHMTELFNQGDLGEYLAGRMGSWLKVHEFMGEDEMFSRSSKAKTQSAASSVVSSDREGRHERIPVLPARAADA
jgi:hypothetical protein